MKKIVVLSSLSVFDTCNKLNIVDRGATSCGISLLRQTDKLIWICYASPLNRRLILPFIEQADSVVLLYDAQDSLSVLRARRWKCYNNKTVYHNIIR